MPTCIVDGCNKESYRKGLRKRKTIDLTTKYCRKHLRWITTRGNTEPTKFSRGTLEERFNRRMLGVDKSIDKCWDWAGAKDSRGYGKIGFENKTLLTHRVSYTIYNGEIPIGLSILHSCDNPSCVNPAHLRAGTCSENIQEAFDKGRKVQPIMFGEKNPKSKLTIEQVRFIKDNPQLGHKAIADMFGLSPNCIRGVRIGRTWKDVE
jgi:hypothetical protein